MEKGKDVSSGGAMYNFGPGVVWYAQIAQMLGIGGATPKAAVHNLIRQIRNLMKRINEPFYVTDCRVEKEAFLEQVPVMAQKAMQDGCTETNPRVPEPCELESLYRELCKGGSV